MIKWKKQQEIKVQAKIFLFHFSFKKNFIKKNNKNCFISVFFSCSNSGKL